MHVCSPKYLVETVGGRNRIFVREHSAAIALKQPQTGSPNVGLAGDI